MAKSGTHCLSTWTRTDVVRNTIAAVHTRWSELPILSSGSCVCTRKTSLLTSRLSTDKKVSGMLRAVYFVLGLLMVVLGIIGIFVPLMPTTSFLILAAWCFARSSRRAEAWILNHPKFGPPIRAWQQNRAIARRYKVMSIGGMALGLAVFVLTAHPAWWVASLLALAILALATYVATRPEPRWTLAGPSS